VVTARFTAVYVLLVLTIGFHVEPPSVEYSHLRTDPVYPESVSRVLLVAEHTFVPPPTAPATVGGSTVIVDGVDLVEEQAPLWTSTRYCVVTARLTAVYVVVVMEIILKDAQLLVEYSHLTTEPVCPDKVSKVLLVPLHTLVLGVTAPPTVAGEIVTVAGVELAGAQTPLCTTARYRVVIERLIAVYVLTVLAIGFHVKPPSVEYSHLRIDPVYPESVSNVLLVPVHLCEFKGFTAPAIVAGSTVTAVGFDVAEHPFPSVTVTE